MIALYRCEASAVLALLAINRYYNLLGTLTVRQLAIIAARMGAWAQSQE